jgi:hypothetical protein
MMCKKVKARNGMATPLVPNSAVLQGLERKQACDEGPNKHSRGNAPTPHIMQTPQVSAKCLKFLRHFSLPSAHTGSVQMAGIGNF